MKYVCLSLKTSLMLFGNLNFEGNRTVASTFMRSVLHVCNLKVGLETCFTIEEFSYDVDSL